MPPEIPTFRTTNTTTARTYHLKPIGDMMGWALATINDHTGELTIQSDWGNWCHRWSADPKHLGAPSLTHFIAGRFKPEKGSCQYLADKLTDERDKRLFDADKTVEWFMQRLCENRLEQGRCHMDMGGGLERARTKPYGHRARPLTKELARELWEALDGELRELDGSGELFLERFYAIPGHDWICEDAWDALCHRRSFAYEVLIDGILPALVEACFAVAFPGRHRCTLTMRREDGAGHWRDFHRGHGCHLDETPISTAPAAPAPAGA